MTATLKGGCLCGAVRYQIAEPLVDAGYCHCRLCQRSSGAPVLAWLTVLVDSFAYLQGDPAIYQSSLQSQREFCRNCGTQLIFRQSHHPRTLDVTLASLDDPSLVQPEYHIWHQSRIDWFEISDVLPRYRDAGPDDHDM